MPRNETVHNRALARGTAYVRYEPKDMTDALRLVREDEMSVAYASRATGVPQRTVYRHVNNPNLASRRGAPTILSDHEEQQLLTYIFMMSDIASASPKTTPTVTSSTSSTMAANTRGSVLTQQARVATGGRASCAVIRMWRCARTRSSPRPVPRWTIRTC